MIGKIIAELSSVSPEVGQRYGLCERRGDIVYQYVGGGNGEQVNIDQNGTWSYFRLTGTIRISKEDGLVGCINAYRHSIPIRFVLATRRDADVCDVTSRIIAARNAFPATKRAIQTATGANLNVLMPLATIEADTTRALKSEMPTAAAPLELVFQYADLTLDLLSENECLILC